MNLAYRLQADELIDEGLRRVERTIGCDRKVVFYRLRFGPAPELRVKYFRYHACGHGLDGMMAMSSV